MASVVQLMCQLMLVNVQASRDPGEIHTGLSAISGVLVNASTIAVSDSVSGMENGSFFEKNKRGFNASCAQDSTLCTAGTACVAGVCQPATGITQYDASSSLQHSLHRLEAAAPATHSTTHTFATTDAPTNRTSIITGLNLSANATILHDTTTNQPTTTTTKASIKKRAHLIRAADVPRDTQRRRAIERSVQNTLRRRMLSRMKRKAKEQGKMIALSHDSQIHDSQIHDLHLKEDDKEEDDSDDEEVTQLRPLNASEIAHKIRFGHPNIE